MVTLLINQFRRFLRVHMAAAHDVLAVTNFVLSFPTWCLGSKELGLNCVSS